MRYITKKIAIPFEGDHFPQESLELVRKLNELSPVWLSATFVPEVDYSALWSMAGGIAGAVFVPEIPDEDAIVARNGARLEEFCRAYSIRLTIHKDRLDFALPLIRKEARFSDLMLLSGTHFFDNIDSRQPNTYMKDILHTAECPVLLLPDAAYMPENIVLAYDGTPASVTAIKQFARLFPEFAGREITLVHLDGERDAPLPDQEYIEELASTYFTHCRLLNLRINHRDFFSTWLPARQKPWLVAGGFGRGEVSQLFNRSFVAEVIREHKIPVFIAH
ncbi:MAG: hypothetical protein J0H74_32870 [Chitinophagaceae bacterium]|nr:hypothetical protein [Chitinophagaceae bacterium]